MLLWHIHGGLTLLLPRECQEVCGTTPGRIPNAPRSSRKTHTNCCVGGRTMTASTTATSSRPGATPGWPNSHPVSSVQGFAPVLPGNKVPSKTAIGPRWSRHLCRMPCEVRLALTRGHVPSISTANGSSRVATNTADVILHPVSVQRSPVLQDAERPAGGGSGLHQVVSVGAGTGTASGSV